MASALRRRSRDVSNQPGRGDDEGAAMLEFVALSLLLLVPLVYLVVTVGRVQAAAFAAESAAAGAARAAVVEGVAQREAGASRSDAMVSGTHRAEAVVALSSVDFGFGADDASVELICEGPCLEPGSNIAAQVSVTVSLPGIPGIVGSALPLEVRVSGSSRAPVDSVARDS